MCFVIYLRTNSDSCHLHHELIGFYNQDEKGLLRGTNWIFKLISLPFVFKWLKSTILCCPILVNPEFLNILYINIHWKGIEELGTSEFSQGA